MYPTTKPSARIRAYEETLRETALGYPETHEDRPWGHAAFKVKKKAFCFLVADANGLSLSVKLPESNNVALMLPFAQPTGYGLGKSGWVSAQFAPDAEVPIPMLVDWLKESYCAIAPRKLAAQVEGGSSGAARAPVPAARKLAKKKLIAKSAAVKAKAKAGAGTAKKTAAPTKAVGKKTAKKKTAAR